MSRCVVGERGWTSLHRAAALNRVDDLRREAGAGGVDCQDDDLQLTPLHVAAIKGNLACVEALIALGADLELPMLAGLTPLHAASRKGRTACVQALLRAGADVNSEGSESSTPLMEAAESGSVETCLALISAGADVNHVNDFDTPPFSIALGDGHRRVLGLLLEAGAAIDTRDVPRDKINESAFLYVDTITKNGGYKAHVKKHRRILTGYIKKLQSQEGRHLPDDVAPHVLSFWTPPGGPEPAL